MILVYKNTNKLSKNCNMVYYYTKKGIYTNFSMKLL